MKSLVIAVFLLGYLPAALAQFVSTKVVDTGSGGFVGMHTAQAVVAGNPAIFYEDRTKSRLLYMRNTAADGSGAWVTTVVDDNASILQTSDSHVLRIVAGNPAVCWATNSGVYFARSSTADGSGAWAVHFVANGSDCSLEVVDGKPAVSCSEGSVLILARCSTADGSGEWTTYVVDDVGDTGYDSSLAVVNGKPAISYRAASPGSSGPFAPKLPPSAVTLTDYGLRYARCSTADGSGSWTVETVETGTNTGIDTSLVVVDGKPAIGYYNAQTKDLMYARNAAADGSGVWTVVAVDSLNSVGLNPSLAVVDGKPAMSYGYGSSGDLRFARNTAADGSGAWTIVNVDTPGATGTYTSLAVVDGTPAISYHYATGTDLKWARNSLADGSGTWTLATLDNGSASGVVGDRNEIAMIAGKPAAVYFDSFNARLKFAIASSANGLGTWATYTPPFSAYTQDASLHELDGRPAIVYSDGSTGYTRFAINSAADGSGTWTSTVVYSGFTFPVGRSMAVIGGYPMIYIRAQTGPIIIARNSAADGSGTWTLLPTGIESSYGNSFGEVDGKPAFTCFDKLNNDIIFARNASADASGAWATTVVKPAGLLATPQLLTVGGNPAIFFTETGSNGHQLYMARNSAADGSGTWTTTHCASVLTASYSVAIVAGKPVITFRSTGGTDLRLLRCTTADGLGAWLNYKLDSGLNLGEPSSVTDVGGKPGLSYNDVSGGNLKYALFDPGTASISVEQPETLVLNAASASAYFYAILVGTSSPVRMFTVRNNGNTTLTVSGINKDGAQAADFILSSTAGFTLAPGATHTFSLTYTPAAAGISTAALHILSDDATYPTFNIALSGEAYPPSGIETWRQLWFGTLEPLGDAADDADPDHDGQPNLMEYALHMNPTQASTPIAQLSIVGGNLEYTYTRSTDAYNDGYVFNIPWTETLNGLDWEYADTVETILSDDGITQQVKATIPKGSGSQRFVRLEVN